MKSFTITAVFALLTFYAHGKLPQSLCDTLDPETDLLYNFGAALHSAKEGWREANSTTVKKIHHPKDWEFVENFLGTIFIIKSPLTSKTDDFSENVTLTKEVMNKNGLLLSLEKYVANKIKEHQSYFENLTIITENSMAQHLEQPSEVLLFTAQKNETTFKILQHFFVKNGMVYIFSYTAEVDLFDTYKAIANDIFKSLEL